MNRWDEARRELDAWADARLKARFWVRDDDAFEVSENLVRLRDVAAKFDTRIGLAIIPGKIAPGLCEFISDNPAQFYPMCHGWKHINYNSGKRPAEFGPDRPISNMISDAQFALRLFKEHFGTSKPIFVPPFNRITPALTKALPSIGFFGVSLMPNELERMLLRIGSCVPWNAAIRIPHFKGSPRIDVHVDLIDWSARTAQGAGVVADQLVQHLRGRRLGIRSPHTPIGLLTHHLAHNEPVWRAVDDVLGFLRSHDAVEFIDVGEWINECAPGPIVADVGDQKGAVSRMG